MEGDHMRQTDRNGPPYFNPLPPHGGRLCYRANLLTAWKFQSTPSAWRETTGQTRLFAWMREFQSTPSAWRETVIGFAIALCVAFQSTPSAWRETGLWRKRSNFPTHFNPLPPHGGRRPGYSPERAGKSISIHSLRMEGDKTMVGKNCRQRYFNPLPPHGGRQDADRAALDALQFQSTPSAWRETSVMAECFECLYISIHSLRMEGDRFYNFFFSFTQRISIHSLRMEGDYILLS